MNEDLIKNIENIVSRLGYECVNVALKNDLGKLRLQVLIDLIGGINVDDCERVSKNINSFLDKNENFYSELDNGRYYLEVSSPGIERPLFKLSDYERFSGREARIKINGLIDGRKTFTGELSGVDSNENLNENFVFINVEGNIKKIPFDLIRSGSLIFRFEDENKNKKNKNKSSKNSKSKKNKNLNKNNKNENEKNTKREEF